MMVEQRRESFYVSLVRPDDLDDRIKIDNHNKLKEVSIIDDDGKLYC